MLQVVLEAELREQLEEVFPHHAAHVRADRQAQASSSVSATKTSRTSRQSPRHGMRPDLRAPASTLSQWDDT